MLSAIGNKIVDEGTPLTFTAQATDTDQPANTLTFTLEGALEGATINPTTGEFTFTPTEAQGPGSFIVIVRVTDNGSPAKNDFEQITITVNEVNLPPNLPTLEDITVTQGQLATFQAMASDPDLPANTLTYFLDVDDAPPGASIDPSTGVFTWTPSLDQEPGDYIVRVIVVDNGNPAMLDTETVTIHVNPATRTEGVSANSLSAPSPGDSGEGQEHAALDAALAASDIWLD